MKTHTSIAVVVGCTLMACAAATQLVMAQTTAARGAPVIYPAKDQSAKQQDQDRYACHDWARAQSGHDPSQANPTTVAAAPAVGATAPSGGSTGTMVRGAAGGAAIAELSHHDTGRGAATGLIGASLIGRIKDRQATQTRQQQGAQQAQLAQQQSARVQQAATYERAFAACLEARGYVVK
jgi:hypothetical protein